MDYRKDSLITSAHLVVVTWPMTRLLVILSLLNMDTTRQLDLVVAPPHPKITLPTFMKMPCTFHFCGQTNSMFRSSFDNLYRGKEVGRNENEFVYPKLGTKFYCRNQES